MATSFHRYSPYGTTQSHRKCCRTSPSPRMTACYSSSIWVHLGHITTLPFSDSFCYCSSYPSSSSTTTQLIDTPLLKFFLQFLGGLVDETIELFSNTNFFFALGFDVLFNFGELLKIILKLLADLGGFLKALPILQLLEKVLLHGLKLQLPFLNLLVESPNMPKQFIDLRRYQIESMQKLLIRMLHLSPLNQNKKYIIDHLFPLTYYKYLKPNYK